MSNPLDKAGAKAPPIIGSGCTQRYDPDQMGPELGTDFPDAETLWKRYLNALDGAAGDTPIDDAEPSSSMLAG
ncbi:hypothetical protein CXF92_09630 [Pseudomonas sp. Choline-3u-10]|jgi:hypothetical protein|uniref:hypothetical protein n=1 Tax=Pseudomonadaceae TaxID=135621 RepID=UPI000617D96E|nr:MULTISPECIES: hypothetical protein [Pseudomonadaceae]MAL37086.1 hypothetical protein [Pseudomonas sp.]MBU0949115.1 hypothetical protein [Gammaproteobacteria bacterium]KJJ63222.1 hypothetical protein RT21_10845 [Pseudomonas sp. 10B238]MBK3796352.1 hypothetical protein [Stutzerimonas stutzeri]MBK3876855.1 hypothetical protein [Stutzerimonas stutzeri]|tara:strand:- start:820 stop:1038 length:219 start_codon:yes stop_codon:yes gene_type:complete